MRNIFSKHDSASYHKAGYSAAFLAVQKTEQLRKENSYDYAKEETYIQKKSLPTKGNS